MCTCRMLRLIDYFLPKPIREKSEAPPSTEIVNGITGQLPYILQNRILISSLLLIFGMALTLLPSSAIYDKEIAFTILLGSLLVMISSMVLLYFNRKSERAYSHFRANTTIAVIYLVMLAYNFGNGGIFKASSVFLINISMIVVLLTPPRVAKMWFLAIVFQIILFSVVNANHWLEFPLIRSDEQNTYAFLSTMPVYCFLAFGMALLSQTSYNIAIQATLELVREINYHRKTAEEARDVAIAFSKQKADFSIMISHEIRTPLHAIVGMLEMILEESTVTDHDKECVEVAQMNAKGLMLVLNDVLDLSKIEAGQLHLNRMLVDMLQLIEDTVKELSVRAHTKGLQICLDIIPFTRRTLFVDPIRMKQVLVNLIENAIKFTSHGEVVLTVGDLMGNFSISISDSGSGIARDLQQNIFLAFSQEKTGGSRAHGGIGLGLNISHHLIKAMDGNLDLESFDRSVFTDESLATVKRQLWGRRRCLESCRTNFLVTFPLADTIQAENNFNSIAELDPLHSTRMHLVSTNPTAVVLVSFPLRIYDHYLFTLLEELNLKVQLLDIDNASELSKALVSADYVFISEQLDLVAIKESIPGETVFPHTKLIVVRRGYGVKATEMVMKAIESRSPTRSKSPVAALSNKILLQDIAGCFIASAGVRQPIFSTAILEAIDSLETIIDDQENDDSVCEQVSDFTEQDTLLRDKKILVVDDNNVNLKIATRMLRSICKDFDVYQATGGVSALELIESHKYDFDLILMDIQMPGIDGIETTKQLRARELELGRKDLIPVVAQTANGLAEEKEEILKVMNEYLGKPYTLAQFRQKISLFLDI